MRRRWRVLLRAQRAGAGLRCQGSPLLRLDTGHAERCQDRVELGDGHQARRRDLHADWSALRVEVDSQPVPGVRLALEDSLDDCFLETLDRNLDAELLTATTGWRHLKREGRGFRERRGGRERAAPRACANLLR